MRISYLFSAVCLLAFAFFMWFRHTSLVGDFSTKEEPNVFVTPLGLPPMPWPPDNPYSKKKAELGRLLYFDKRLSSDGTVSCATCHSIPRAFTDNKILPIGIEGRKGTRHSPTVINAGFQRHQFWDGRAATLEEQCKGPLGNPKEMTLQDNVHDAHIACLKRIKAIKGYRILFRDVFNKNDFTLDDVAKAISTFERTVVSGNSPYDRYMAGDKTAMTPEQIHGYQVFKKSGCANCHVPPLFTDVRFMNIGIGMDAENPDLGRYVITKKEEDWGAFKVPTLREVTHTYPYGHNGSLKTLEDVVEYYDKGGIPNKNLHPLMKPLHLSEQDKKDLVAFMKALNGEGWQHFTEPKTFPTK